MIHASLFSGIDGFAVAADAMGWETVMHCEINEFGLHVLKHHWPHAKTHTDIKQTDFSVYKGKIDVLTGGFPCQPYSVAGQRKGTADDRHLWPEMLRAIREIQPRWVVGENVRGLVSWNDGLVFEQVQADLEAEGYQVQPVILPAASVGAPHRRDRVWFVAYGANARAEGVQRSREIGVLGLRPVTNTCSNGITGRPSTRDREKENKAIGSDLQQPSTGLGIQWTPSNPKIEGGFGLPIGAKTEYSEHDELGSDGDVTNPDNKSLQRRQKARNVEEFREEPYQQSQRLRNSDYWQNFPTQSPVCIGNDGFPTESLRQRIREDSMGVISEKEINQILSKAAAQWRNETIKAAGNAVVPQVVLQLFRAIENSYY